MALGARIKHYRTQAGLTLEQLSERSGVDVGTINALENRDSSRSKFAPQLAAALNVPLTELHGDPVTLPPLPPLPYPRSLPPIPSIHGVAEAQAAYHGRSNVDPGPDLRGKVPLISWIQAGEWCEASDPFQPGDAEKWLSCPAPHSDGTFALRVRGDSMTAPHGNSRTYPEGSIIFVDPSRLAPVNGERVVACLGLEGTHDVTFKVYKNEDGRQWLQPLNPSHEPIREPFRILGTVIGKWEDE